MVAEGLQNGATVREKWVYAIKFIFSRFSEVGQNWVYKTWSRKIYIDISYEMVYPDLFLHVESIAVEVEPLRWLENGQKLIFSHFLEVFGPLTIENVEIGSWH